MHKLFTFLKYLLVIVLCLGLGFWRLKSSYESKNYYEVEGDVLFDTVKIGSFVSGNVKEVNITEGDFVNAGDLILEIENDILVQRFEGLDPESPNFIQSEYNELEQKIENLKVYSPVDAYVTNVDFTQDSFVRENEIIAELAKADTLQMVGNVTFGEKFATTNEFRDSLVVGLPVLIEYFDNNQQFEATVVDIDVQPDLGEITLFLLADVEQIIIGREFSVLIYQATALDKLVELYNNLLGSFESSASVSGYVQD